MIVYCIILDRVVAQHTPLGEQQRQLKRHDGPIGAVIDRSVPSVSAQRTGQKRSCRAIHIRLSNWCVLAMTALIVGRNEADKMKRGIGSSVDHINLYDFHRV